MIENLNLKLEGKEPVTRIELFELVSSWGRKDSFRIDENIKIEKCKFQECYPLENIDVSQIKDFDEIFRESYYNGNLSNWNISNARTLRKMFIHSEFNNDSISNWDVSNVKDMRFLFYETNFNKDISKWDISNCINMLRMFEYSKFDGDTNEFKKKIAFLFKFFNEIFVSLKQCGLNYVISNRFSLLESLIN